MAGAGVLVAHEVRGLAELSDTAGKTGRAAIAVGDAVQALPLVGEQFDEPADAVRAAGADAVASARSARASARRVGLLLGRLDRRHSRASRCCCSTCRPGSRPRGRRRALRRAVAAGGHRAVDEVLAWRAVDAPALPQASARSATTRRAISVTGTHRPLADAELGWFGVARPKSRSAARR